MIQKIWNLASPSNVATVALIAFLLVGQMTDWSFISRSSSKAQTSVRFGTIDHSAATPALKVKAGRDRSELADRRTSHEPAQKQRELD